jgi:hypothetical protein
LRLPTLVMPAVGVSEILPNADAHQCPAAPAPV